MQLTNAEISIANCILEQRCGFLREAIHRTVPRLPGDTAGVRRRAVPAKRLEEAGPCTVDFLRSTIAHINATVSAKCTLSMCPAYMADLTITNVSLIATPTFIHDSVLAGFFTALSNVTITDSGTSSYVIVVSFGELDGLTLDNPASGQGLYILSIDGSIAQRQDYQRSCV